MSDEARINLTTSSDERVSFPVEKLRNAIFQTDIKGTFIYPYENDGRYFYCTESLETILSMIKQQ